VRPFDYHAATSVAEAVDLLHRFGEDAVLMAGGTALVLLMKQGLLRPARVIGLRGVSSLRGITRDRAGALRINALVTHREAELSPLVREHCPALAEAFRRVATVRIREQGTVGGNLVHADPAQDPPPMLLALGAEVVIAGRDAERVIPCDRLFVDYFQTSLAPNEVLLAVRVPPLSPGARATYATFLPRTADDYATVSVAAVMRVENGICREVRVALGAVAAVPLRARRVENALRDQRVTPAAIRDAAALAREEVDPIPDRRGSVAYKREMARVWIERALRSLANAA
jgi:carbon-monoxide dehydrogenase medium subunit